MNSLFLARKIQAGRANYNPCFLLHNDYIVRGKNYNNVYIVLLLNVSAILQESLIENIFCVFQPVMGR